MTYDDMLMNICDGCDNLLCICDPYEVLVAECSRWVGVSSARFNHAYAKLSEIATKEQIEHLRRGGRFPRSVTK